MKIVLYDTETAKQVDVAAKHSTISYIRRTYRSPAAVTHRCKRLKNKMPRTLSPDRIINECINFFLFVVPHSPPRWEMCLLRKVSRFLRCTRLGHLSSRAEVST